MPAPLPPLREARRARLRQIYGVWLARDVATLKAARNATFRAIIPGCAAGVAVAVLVVVLFVRFSWPPAWWANPLALLRLAVIAAGVVWLGRTFLFARPDAGDAELWHQDDQLRDIVRRLFGQIRPGASYEPDAPFERHWLKAAGLPTEATRSDSAHRVRWRSGDVDVVAGEVDVYIREAGGTDDTTVRGWVAVGTMPEGWKANVRIRHRASAFAASAPDDRMPVVDVAGLGEAYVVTASDPGTARHLLGADLLEQLRDNAASGRRVHVTIAWRKVGVMVEHAESWFQRLHHTLDEAHVVLIGETFDLLDDVIASVASNGAPGES